MTISLYIYIITIKPLRKTFKMKERRNVIKKKGKAGNLWEQKIYYSLNSLVLPAHSARKDRLKAGYSVWR